MKFAEKYFHAVVIAVCGSFLSSIAFAQNTYTAQGTVVEVTPVYQNITKQIPTQTCNTVQVPVYGNGGQQGSQVFGLDLEGAIIGGVLGNNVTKNVENGGTIGALIGGMMGSQRKQNNQQIVGYREEQRCGTTYSTQSEQVVTHKNIVVDAGGYKVQAQTRRDVQVGDVVTVNIALSVQ